MLQTDTLIVGGGLAGLSLARRLHMAGRRFHLVEARGRFGGRIHTATAPTGARFDLGPAWFWQGQPRIANLVEAMGQTVFEQYSTGDLVFEDETGAIHRGRGFSSMEGSYRLKGGLTALIGALADGLPATALSLSTKVAGLIRTDAGVTAHLERADGHRAELSAQTVFLALPPRLVARSINFEPDLPETAYKAMRNIPTWMAGQAKIMAIYERPFWRDEGFSGDGRSRLGPVVEFHDASPMQDGPYALFGFVGTPPLIRNEHKAEFREAVRQQLIRLFGAAAAEPLQLEIQDWAFEPETATPLDLEPLSHHPHYGMPQALENLWADRLGFCSSEVAATFGGYLEGALEAAEAADRLIAARTGSLLGQS